MAGWFSISYMGCHPPTIDELHHFSRWLLHQQPELVGGEDQLRTRKRWVTGVMTYDTYRGLEMGEANGDLLTRVTDYEPITQLGGFSKLRVGAVFCWVSKEEKHLGWLEDAMGNWMEMMMGGWLIFVWTWHLGYQEKWRTSPCNELIYYTSIQDVCCEQQSVQLEEMLEAKDPPKVAMSKNQVSVCIPAGADCTHIASCIRHRIPTKIVFATEHVRSSIWHVDSYILYP